jgi:hypothetical protein
MFIVEGEVRRANSGFSLTVMSSARLTHGEEREIRRILFEHFDEIIEAWKDFRERTQ